MLHKEERTACISYHLLQEVVSDRAVKNERERWNMFSTGSWGNSQSSCFLSSLPSVC